MWEVETGELRFKGSSDISNNKLGVAVHICNPRDMGGRGRRSQSETSPGKKQEIISEKIN
jgi:hypothetical protein